MNRADQIDAEISKAARKGVFAARLIGRQVREAAIRAYRANQNVSLAIREKLAPLAQVLNNGMAAAHGQGIVSAIKHADMRVSGKNLDRADVYNKDLRFVQSRLLLTDAEKRGLVELYGAEAATVTGEVGTELESKVLRAIAEATRQDLHVRDGIKLIEDAFDAAGVTPANSYTLENIFRTQVAMASTAGRLNANAAPEIDEILWGYEYVTVGDDRVRDAHAEMEGTRAPKDDPIWRTWMPPNGYSCRCQVIEIFVDDAPSDRRRKVPTALPATDPGWDFNPGDFFQAQLTQNLVGA